MEVSLPGSVISSPEVEDNSMTKQLKTETREFEIKCRSDIETADQRQRNFKVRAASTQNHVTASNNDNREKYAEKNTRLHELKDSRSESPVVCECDNMLCSILRPSLTAARRFAEAQKCERWYCRRNALADPQQMAISQNTRERIEKEVLLRQTSVSRKISHFFISKIDPEPEVDLI